jgi:hypothetical protein
VATGSRARTDAGIWSAIEERQFGDRGGCRLDGKHDFTSGGRSVEDFLAAFDDTEDAGVWRAIPEKHFAGGEVPLDGALHEPLDSLLAEGGEEGALREDG